MLTLVEYQYQPEGQRVQRVILAQEEHPDNAPLRRPAGIVAWRGTRPNGYEVFILEDDSTEIIHPIVSTTVLGKLIPTEGVLWPVEAEAEYRASVKPRGIAVLTPEEAAARRRPR